MRSILIGTHLQAKISRQTEKNLHRPLEPLERSFRLWNFKRIRPEAFEMRVIFEIK
jgi:hypothetical protein